MLSIGSVILQASLVLIPSVIAALGGIVALKLRKSPTGSRIAQFACSAGLLGVAGTGRMILPASAFWFVPLLLGLVLAIQLTMSTGISSRIVERLVRASVAFSGPGRWGMLMIGLCPLLFAGGLLQVNAMTAPVADALLDTHDFPVPDLELDQQISASTDHGSLVPLYKLRGGSEDSMSIEGNQGLPTENSPLPYRAVRVTEPDSVSNCIGWVFADSQRWIYCRDVQQILDDNNYRAMETPVIGDLAVYRDNAGMVTHVAKVVAFLEGNRPLMQSKWGYQGVFLHLADGTPYGVNFQYYHSPRAGHALVFSSPHDRGSRSAAEATP